MTSVDARSGKPLVIERITVKADRVEALVRVSPDGAWSTAQRAQRILQAFPSLADHTCVNAEGPAFASVIDHTSIPHVLEHLVIQLMCERSDDPAASFVGTTQWVAQSNGSACVKVSFTDDVMALRAFRDAAEFLNCEVLQ